MFTSEDPDSVSRMDVVVVGAGNAALCAALAAAEGGARVLVLERADRAQRGGNSAFTAGAMRVVYHGVDDIRTLVPDLSDSEVSRTDFGQYTETDFFADMARVTEHRADPDLVDVLVERSFETLNWMRTHGIRFLPIYGRQAYDIGGRFRFWGGLTLEVRGGGRGLVDTLVQAAEKAGVVVRYDSRAVNLVMSQGRVVGVDFYHDDKLERVLTGSVVLASGGFESNVEWRTRYLGPGWDLAKVRGTLFNTGDGIRMALDVGAAPWGQWSGAHAVAWDYNAPPFGDLEVGDGFQKHSYPLGIMLNLRGERFVDEGADFRNYTYAKYGRVILAQPGQVAWQVFDAKVTHLLRDEYRIRQVTKVGADSIAEMASRIDGMHVDAMVRTIDDYNQAVVVDRPFDPNIRDGRRTVGLHIDKTNWANTIEQPPFAAYGVTCGMTFTFGGVRVSPDAQVLDDIGRPVQGLFAAGEIIGGLFYFNYPGGAGLTSGAVFGRIAGSNAAGHAARLDTADGDHRRRSERSYQPTLSGEQM